MKLLLKHLTWLSASGVSINNARRLAQAPAVRTASFDSSRVRAPTRKYKAMALSFTQLQDPESSTFTYILADDTSKEAIIIDPVLEQASRKKQHGNLQGLIVTLLIHF